MISKMKIHQHFHELKSLNKEESLDNYISLDLPNAIIVAKLESNREIFYSEQINYAPR